MVNVFFKNYAGKWKLLFSTTTQHANVLIETRDTPELWKFEDVI